MRSDSAVVPVLSAGAEEPAGGLRASKGALYLHRRLFLTTHRMKKKKKRGESESRSKFWGHLKEQEPSENSNLRILAFPSLSCLPFVLILSANP